MSIIVIIGSFSIFLAGLYLTLMVDKTGSTKLRKISYLLLILSLSTGYLGGLRISLLVMMIVAVIAVTIDEIANY